MVSKDMYTKAMFYS